MSVAFVKRQERFSSLTNAV